MPHTLHRCFFILALASLAACSTSQGEGEQEARALQPDSSTFTAQGNEPFWHLVVNDGVASLNRLGKEPVELPVNEVTVSDQLCHDSMTGMPYPLQVSLRYQGERYKGCGGEPAELLQAAEWQVTTVAGGPVSEWGITVRFSSESEAGDRGGELVGDRPRTGSVPSQGMVSGYSGCNRFTGRYQLTGENLTIGPLASTRMACEEDAMVRESEFLQALETVYGFSLRESEGEWELILVTPGEPVTAGS